MTLGGLAMERFELPEGWEWKPFGEYIGIQGGYAFKSSEYKSSGLPIIRISNLENETVHTIDSPCMDSAKLKEFSQYVLHSGDVLIALSGATTGKLGVVPDTCDNWLLNQRVGRFYAKKVNAIEPKYIYWAARNIQRIILASAYGGAQPNISPSDIEAMEFPFPPLIEQRRILARIEGLTKRVEEAKKLANEALAELDTFTPALLAKAFRGKL